MTMEKDLSTDERIVKDLDTNFMVEAGAGTGKTYALCSRVVALVKTGVFMRDIVAITFTETMATELSERIRSRMEQLLDKDYRANHDDLLAYNLNDEQQALIQQAIDELDQAAIQTIHSFAAQLLRERPLAANLPPGWVVLDEVAAAERFAERWDRWLRWALGDANGAIPNVTDFQPHLRRLLDSGSGVDRWIEIAKAFTDNFDRLTAVNNVPDGNLQFLCDQALRRLDELGKKCTNRNDAVYRTITSGMSAVSAIQQVADDPFEAARLYESGKLDFPSARGRMDENWDTDIAGVRKAINEDIRAPFLNALQRASLVHDLVALLSKLRSDLALVGANQRKAEGVSTFDDLLIWARGMLRDDAESRQYFQRKYSHILVDEFQDTDPLQAEIAFYLASQPDANIAGQPWHKLPLKPGKLFIVGDVKQSIYRFRGADIAVTELVRINPDMEPLTLTENRRSRQPVLDWVNNVFSELMRDQPHQAEYLALKNHPQGQADSLQGSVHVFGGPVAEGTSADGIRHQQADHIAQIIVESVGDDAANGLQVYDRDHGCVRGATLQDISILVRSRTGLNILTRTLDGAKIPYRLEGGALLFDTQEVQDLVNCLRAIDDPTGEVSVVAALRSPAFACSDVDLLAWRDARGSWNYLSTLLSDDELGADNQARRERLQTVPRVWIGMKTLREYHQNRRAGRVSQLIAKFCRELRLDELDLAEYRPRETWRRRQYLIEQARQLEYASGSDQGSSPLTLYRFIRWAESRQEENTRIAEAVIPEPDDDAVRIMTIHAAKGQEFPVVILLGLDNDPTNWGGRGRPPVLFHPKKGTAEVLAGSWQDGKGLMTPDYHELEDVVKQQATAEMVRLAYVGATRARDHLLVSLYQSEKDFNDAKKLGKVVAASIQRMQEPLEGDKRHPDWPAAGASVGEYIAHSANSVPVQLAEYDLEDWRKNRRDNIADRSMPQAVTATGIARAAAPSDAALEDKDADPSTERVGRAGRGGTAFGTAVHAVLQETVDQLADRLPLTEDDLLDTLLGELDPNIEQIAARHADSPDLRDRQGEIVGLVNSTLRSPTVEAALRAPRQWSEIPVAASIPTSHGPVVIEGIIDLMYQDEDGQLVILDYKSDRVDSEKDVDTKLEHYGMQGAAYAAAVENATGQTVKAVHFLFVRRKDGLRKLVNFRDLIKQIPELIVHSVE